MNDPLQPSASTPDSASEAPDRDFAPTEIDARHAQQLIERAFSQLERGERAASEVAIRQAIHLTPNVSAAHSFAGFLALMNGDIETARIAYENAVPDFSKASPERERLIALRMAQADKSGINAGELVPDVPVEIARLRGAIAQTPLQEFLSAPKKSVHVAPAKNYIAAPSPAISNSANPETRPAFSSRLEQRKRASAWAVGIAAVSAAIVAFFVMRSLTGPKTAPQAGSTPVANSIIVENAPLSENAVADSATETPGISAAGNPPAVAKPAANVADDGSTPAATVTVKPLPPTPTAPVTRPRPAPKPQRPTAPPAATPVFPGLPRPAPKPSTTPRETPTPTPAPRETPSDPNFPAMPPPKITLPSAGGEKTEYPRVIPDND